MNGMMNGGTMWGMGSWGFPNAILVLLGLAALVLYLFFRRRG